MIDGLTKLQKSTIELADAYDTRNRIFNQLRRLDIDDEKRAALIDEYKTAASHFDTLKRELKSK